MSAALVGSAHKIVHTNRQPNYVRRLGSKGAIVKLISGSFAAMVAMRRAFGASLVGIQTLGLQNLPR